MSEKDNKEKELQVTAENAINHELLFNDLNSAQNLLTGLNGILNAISNEIFNKNVEVAVSEYLDTDKTKQAISTFLDTELTDQTTTSVQELITLELEKFNLEAKIKESLLADFDKIVTEYLQSKSVPFVNVIKLNETEIGRTKDEHFHEKFEEILSLVQLDEPVMLIGPAGAGKNHSVFQVAQALGKTMYYTNNASNEFKLTGFIDAGGKYQETQFYKAFKHGGLFMLDEIDNSDPSALIVINSALANGYMAFPHETIERHPDFRIVAAANTWGKGSDLQYVGRNILDGATLDRFDNIFFNYDTKLEQALYPNQEVLEFMWLLRDVVDEIKIRHIISTRGIGKVYKKALNNIPVETILRTNVIKHLRQDDINLILGSMAERINPENRYYLALKALKIGR